jgi:GH24 family phage-related lysozyme (muramidase)/LysM repeat protein
MSDPVKTPHDELKSTVSVRLLDPLGKSIEGLKYQIKQGEKIVAKGITDSKGNISSFISQIGTELSLHVERFATEEMKEVRKLIPWAEDFRVKLLSGKVKEEVTAKKDSGPPGAYVRKTHVVEKGDTLGKIAKKYHTTAEAIAKLNHIDITATIFEKQVLKVPPEKGSSSAAPSASSPAQPATTPAKPVTASPPATVAPKDVPVDKVPKTNKPPVSTPIETVKQEARGENGTPKSTVNLTCDATGCIKVGDTGPLVEEINIRLMGFGRTIKPPAEFDVFTENTEKAVKQFQRDYMGVPETGKVCGAVLLAMDDFKAKHPISWAGMSCPCGLCTGWGHGYTDSAAVGKTHGKKHVPYEGIEHPGMHRAVIWTFRAAKFYTEVKDKALGYKFAGLSSGYRCWHRNIQTDRTSTNHMGKALDLQFKKDGEIVRHSLLENLKTKVFVNRMGAAPNWTANKVSLEPISIAPGWVHCDVREFDPRYLKNRFFSKTKEGADGDNMITIARRDGYLRVVNCGGIPPRTAPVTGPVSTVPAKSTPGTTAPAKTAPAKTAPAKTAPVKPTTTAPAQTGPKTPAGPAPGARKPFAELSLSKQGLEFIKGWEKIGPRVGNVTVPYDDSEHYCTVGWGHLIAKKRCSALKSEGDPDFEKYEKGITDEAALALLAKDLARITEKAKIYVQYPLHQYEYDALISLAFNTGGFSKFPKLLHKLNTGDYKGCCDEFADITNKGTSGLVKRRKAEMDVFRNNHYDSTH